jgi:hypothetical protein
MKAKLTIKSQGSGWQDCVVDNNADMTIDGSGVAIDYVINGDKCTLLATPEFTMQTRTGSLNTTIKFVPSKQGFCKFSDGQLQGEYKITVQSYKFTYGEMGCSLVMTYLSGDDEEKINLRLNCLYER